MGLTVAATPPFRIRKNGGWDLSSLPLPALSNPSFPRGDGHSGTDMGGHGSATATVTATGIR